MLSKCTGRSGRSGPRAWANLARGLYRKRSRRESGKPSRKADEFGITQKRAIGELAGASERMAAKDGAETFVRRRRWAGHDAREGWKNEFQRQSGGRASAREAAGIRKKLG